MHKEARAVLHFNPHHREGGDQIWKGGVEMAVDFNPHHREGGDHGWRGYRGHSRISIHTTAKVVTEQDMDMLIWMTISIHTTAKVVTAKSPKFHSHFCIKLLINRLFHTNLTTPFPSIPPFSITQHPKIWCESPNVFLFTSYSH